MIIPEYQLLREKGPYWSYSSPHFPAFRLNTESVRIRENTNQDISEYGHFLHSARVSFGKKSLKMLGPKLWNNLPYHIKSSGKLESF